MIEMVVRSDGIFKGKTGIFSEKQYRVFFRKLFEEKI